MTHEFYYTSVPRGLITGSKGFCAVAMTKGMPSFLTERLEDLSGYKPLYAALDPRNPVTWAYHRLELGGKTYHVLSRIGAAGLDYSERTNKFAHHVVLSRDELPAAGPARLLQHKGFMESAWDQKEPHWLPAGRQPPQLAGATLVCRAWEKLTGDAGWAGVLAETALATPARSALLIYEPNIDVLALFAETFALLPEACRWSLSFSTYVPSLASSGACLWRGIVKSQIDAERRLLPPGALILDLTQRLGPAAGGPLVEAARTGKPAPVQAAPPALSRVPATPSLPTIRTDDSDAPEPTRQVRLSSLHATMDTPAGSIMVDEPAAESNSQRYLEVTLAGVVGILFCFFAVFVGEVFSDASVSDLIREKAKTRKSLEIELAQTISKHETAEQRATRLQEEKETITKDAASHREATDKKQADLRQQLATTKSQVDRLEKKVGDMKSANGDNESKLNTLKTELTSLTHAQHQLRRKFEKLQAKSDPELIFVEKKGRSNEVSLRVHYHYKISIEQPKGLELFDSVEVKGSKQINIVFLKEAKKYELLTADINLDKTPASAKLMVEFDSDTRKSQSLFNEAIEAFEKNAWIVVECLNKDNKKGSTESNFVYVKLRRKDK